MVLPCMSALSFAGLKLMTLAGYNPNKGPEAFTLLASKWTSLCVLFGVESCCVCHTASTAVVTLQQVSLWSCREHFRAEDELFVLPGCRLAAAFLRYLLSLLCSHAIVFASLRVCCRCEWQLTQGWC